MKNLMQSSFTQPAAGNARQVNEAVRHELAAPLFDVEQHAANRLRRQLWNIDVYPYRGIEAGDGAFAVHDAFCREFVRQAINRLDRLDLIALQRIANKLLKTERPADFYEEWAEVFAAQDAATVASQEALYLAEMEADSEWSVEPDQIRM